jgi:sulfate transporter 4
LATLAAIVVSGVISLVDYPEAFYLWRVHKFDFCVWMAAFLGTLFLGAELGLGISVGISLILVLFESAYPPTAELGRLPGTHQYRNIKQYPDAQTYDGIVCIRVDAPMYFANTQHVRDKVLKYYLRAEEHLSKQYSHKDELEQSVPQCEIPKVQFVVLDLSPVAHIDTSALHVLQEMYTTFKKTNDIQLCLANPNPRVMHRFVSSGLADEIGRDRIFVSLHDAVDNCLQLMDTLELKKHNESSSESGGEMAPLLETHPDGTYDNNSAQQQARLDDLMHGMEPSSAHMLSPSSDNHVEGQASTAQGSTSLIHGVPSMNTMTDFSESDFDSSGECRDGNIEIGLKRL